MILSLLAQRKVSKRNGGPASRFFLLVPSVVEGRFSNRTGPFRTRPPFGGPQTAEGADPSGSCDARRGTMGIIPFLALSFSISFAERREGSGRDDLTVLALSELLRSPWISANRVFCDPIAVPLPRCDGDVSACADRRVSWERVRTAAANCRFRGIVNPDSFFSRRSPVRSVRVERWENSAASLGFRWSGAGCRR